MAQTALYWTHEIVSRISELAYALNAYYLASVSLKTLLSMSCWLSMGQFGVCNELVLQAFWLISHFSSSLFH